MSNTRRDPAPALACLSDRPAAVVTRAEGLTAGTAGDALGHLAHGCRVFVLSKGAVSLGDVLTWVLAEIGPADVLLTTWTVGQDEIDMLRGLLDAGAVRSLRLLLDASFPQRHPAYADQVRAAFGPSAVALTVLHAKLAVLVNATWAVTVLTSANLNRNSRLEAFEVSDDAGLARYIVDTLGAWFPAAADTWAVSRAEHRARFEAWHGEGQGREHTGGLDRAGDAWASRELAAAGWGLDDGDEAALLRALGDSDDDD